jgi:hypothetical protein
LSRLRSSCDRRRNQRVSRELPRYLMREARSARRAIGAARHLLPPVHERRMRRARVDARARAHSIESRRVATRVRPASRIADIEGLSSLSGAAATFGPCSQSQIS